LKPFDANGAFCPIEKGEGLRRVAVRGAGVTIFGQGTSFVLQIAATVILARLLTPADFGIVTMVTTFSLVFCSFGLNGFTEAILQREEITDFLASNLFWVNIGVCTILTAMFVALAPLLALFYHNPLVAHVTEGMSLTIVIGGFGWIHLALLNRAMRFTTVSAINVAARLFSVVVSIVLALLGWGYWALVAGSVAQGICTATGAWLMCRWLPRLPRRVAGTGESVKFATNVYLHFAFSYFTRNTDNLIVGWRYSAGALGLYKRAYDLFVLPESQLLAPISAVVVATLSRLSRERKQYQRYFLAGTSVLAFVGMGIGIDFTLVGKDLIRFLLGPGWEEAGRIFVLFGPGVGIMLLYNTHGWIHLSSGRPDRWFRWGVIEFLCTVGLFVIALPWGPAGIAFAWTASFFVLMLPAFWYAGKPIGLGVGPVVATVWKFFVASAVAGCGVALLVRIMPPFATTPGALGALLRLVSVSILFFALYLGAVISLHRGLGPINQTVLLLRDLRPQRKREDSVLAVEIPAAAVVPAGLEGRD
jgi:PST family polysaccharide transporter